MIDWYLRAYSIVFFLALFRHVFKSSEGPVATIRIILVLLVIHAPWLGRIWGIW